MKKNLLTILLFAASMTPSAAQQAQQSRIDVFMGVDFNYRDIHWKKIYEVLVNLTPGVRWQFGNHWQVAGQALIPVYNDYGDYYKHPRLNVASLSKDIRLGRHLLKASGGLFSHERYCLDVEWMLPVTSWLAFDAQMGYTGYISMAGKWEYSSIDRLTGWVGSRVWLNPWQTEFRVRGGRYIYEDYGVSGECYRHFTHCSVGVYGQYSNKSDANGGFKIIVMLPPYSRKHRIVNIRPASNFRLTNNIEADAYSMQMYQTDPEENERQNWFGRDLLQWGVNTMSPDFTEH